MDVLAEGMNLKGGNIILVSDGEQNVNPEVEDVLPQVIFNVIIINKNTNIFQSLLSLKGTKLIKIINVMILNEINTKIDY